MANTELFRTSLIGGYNKTDVMEYINKLETEVERLKSVEEKAAVLEKSVSEFLEKQEQVSVQTEEAPEEKQPEEKEQTVHMTPASILQFSEEEIEKLKEKANKYDESYDAIKKLLLDSRIEAQVILTDARQKAEKILKDAQITSEERARDAELRLLTDARMQANKIIQEARTQALEEKKETQARLATEIKKSTSQVQMELEVIQENMQRLLETIPSRIQGKLDSCLNERQAITEMDSDPGDSL